MQGPSFALTPGQANTNCFIDYTISSTGIKLWQEAIALLTNKFSAKGQDTNQFCELLLERAEKSDWNSNHANIINIIVDGQAINIFTGHGQGITHDIIANSTYLDNEDRRA